MSCFQTWALKRNITDSDIFDSSKYPLTLIRHYILFLLLKNEIDLDIPVILHQGMQDGEVPWQTAIQLAEKL